MPPKGSSSTRARKSTAGNSKPLSKPASKASKPASRSVQVSVDSSDDENAAPARRSKREQTSEDEEEQENDELKSNPSDSDDVAEELTSASAKKRKTSSSRQSKSTTASPPKKSTSGRQSIKGPSSSSKAIKTGSKPSSKSVPAASKKKASTTTKKATTATTAKAGDKRKRTTTSNEDSDDESVPTTRSRSSRGYTWEAEIINMTPEQIMNNLVYHSSIKTDIDADYDHLPGEDKIKFRRDQIIYILPDPQTLPGRSDEIGPEELPDDEYWCARITDCCALDQGQGQEPLGLLRIAWFYTPDQAQRLETLHPDWKKKMKAKRWDEYEMLASDHIDFVGVDAFCGFPEGRIEYSTMIQGLIVDDIERMKKPALRTKSKRVQRIIGLGYEGDKDGSNVEYHFGRLSKETKDERAKRKVKDEKRAIKEAKIRKEMARKGRAAIEREEEDDEVEEATDEE